jgi:hypothetical protein
MGKIGMFTNCNQQNEGLEIIRKDSGLNDSGKIYFIVPVHNIEQHV